MSDSIGVYVQDMYSKGVVYVQITQVVFQFIFIYLFYFFIHLFAFSPKEDFFFICYYLITILQDDDDDERGNAKSLPALHIIPPPSPSRGSSTPHT
jgi:hypothetical protein